MLTNSIRQLYTNKMIENRIESAIISDDEIADSASKKLHSIRTSKKRKLDSIKEKLNNIIKSDKYDSSLQDRLVTQRDGRYVVPVKSEKRRQVEGIIHDQSQSGQTVYIEPRVVVELNNEIRQLELEEKDEIQRILRELSEIVGDFSDEIRGNQEILVFLDLVFARAKYSMSIDGVKPFINDKHIIDLINARHPLLKGNVVPINFKIGEEYSTLVITGPNTGGKTVSLKTVGLLTLMAELGLHIPCEYGSKISVFENIYADIGDKQSIEMSLSTFSASMKNIVEIVEKADKNSLVLFDELGAGTDPTEGAALAMSILDFFTKRNITTITTTHYSELKAYASNTENVENASVEFDVNTLSPTFKLIIGRPGKSNALEISRKLGLDNRIIDNVSNYLSEESRDVEDMISRLDKDRIESEERLKKIEKLELQNRSLKNRLNNEIEKAKEDREKIIEEAKEKAKKIIEDAKETSDDMLKLAKKSTSKEIPDIDRTLNEINDKFKDEQEKYSKEIEGIKNTNVPQNLKIGDRVYILSLKDEAIVVTKPDDNGDLLVQAGILKFNVNIKDLRKLNKDSKDKKSTSSIKNVLKNKRTNRSVILDVRGETVDEAIDNIENFLDDAILTGSNKLKIIHGKGTGALKKGIREYLKTNRNVESFKYGKPNEGGDGVTFIELK